MKYPISFNRWMLNRAVAYLLVSGDTLAHVPHENLRSLLPLGLNPFPFVPLEHALSACVQFESSETLHSLDFDPWNDLRSLGFLQRRIFLFLFLLRGRFRVLPGNVRLPPFGRHRFRVGRQNGRFESERQKVHEVGSLGGLDQICLLAQGIFWGSPSSGQGIFVREERVWKLDRSFRG